MRIRETDSEPIERMGSQALDAMAEALASTDELGRIGALDDLLAWYADAGRERAKSTRVAAKRQSDFCHVLARHLTGGEVSGDERRVCEMFSADLVEVYTRASSISEGRLYALTQARTWRRRSALHALLPLIDRLLLEEEAEGDFPEESGPEVTRMRAAIRRFTGGAEVPAALPDGPDTSVKALTARFVAELMQRLDEGLEAREGRKPRKGTPELNMFIIESMVGLGIVPSFSKAMKVTGKSSTYREQVIRKWEQEHDPMPCARCGEVFGFRNISHYEDRGWLCADCAGV